jgi:hypothetical protein
MGKLLGILFIASLSLGTAWAERNFNKPTGRGRNLQRKRCLRLQ